ncbi:MAG: hypothetical protein OWU84_06245 [Firmicutes bacterium]|nr:hypothetical protein [Bacillota bacterium]
MQKAMAPLVNVLKSCAHVDVASVWAIDHAHNTAQLIAQSRPGIREPSRRLPESVTSGALKEETLAYSGTVDALDPAAPAGFVAVFHIMRRASCCYVLVLYHKESPLNGEELQRVQSVVELIRAVWLDAPRARLKRRVVARGLGDPEERVRRQLAEMLHGPLQTQILLLEQEVHELRKAAATAPHQLAGRLADLEERLARFRDCHLRGLSHQLYPDLIPVGLVPALMSLRHTMQSVIAIQLYISDAFQALDAPIRNQLPERMRLDLYRMVEEAVNNAVRHGQARRLEVWLDSSSVEGLTLVMRDDGAAPGAESASPGFGLRVMARRVRRWGGRMTVEPGLDGGIEIAVTIPFRAALVRRLNVGS